MYRTSGILLHPTSLPGPFGVGDLGPAAFAFVDFLAAAGQGLWQVLPLGPTGYRDSPYQCSSAFAGNPLMISPERLLEAGWVQEADVAPPGFGVERVDFGLVKPWKRDLLDRAYAGFMARAAAADRDDYDRFRAEHRDWLEDYVLYQTFKAHHGYRPWTEWSPEFALRDPSALTAWREGHAHALDRRRFAQYLFFRQWGELRAYAHARGVRLIGDVPIFVAHDSSEVWTHPEWFQLDGQGHPTVVAGVPPDYFSATGQRWGNPLYRWDVLEQDGYRFWIERLRRVLNLVDTVRIDHFRGFAGDWEIEASEPTAINGRWMPGPGTDLFRALRAALGEDLPLIAEDLGVITEDVEALRDSLGLPGMAVLQFAFEGMEDGIGLSAFLPHNHRRRLAVYTGTHDNDTLRGWWAGRDSEDSAPRPMLPGRHRRRGAMGSHPRRALLGRGNGRVPDAGRPGARRGGLHEPPGTAEGNWVWRYRADQIDAGSAQRLRELSRLCGRLPYPAEPTD